MRQYFGQVADDEVDDEGFRKLMSYTCRRERCYKRINESYHIISYHIISYHIISYHIISYHIISYHIISYLVRI